MFQKLGLWSSKPADRIGKTETLHADLGKFLDEAGERWSQPAKPPHRNAVERRIEAEAVVTPAMRQRIMDAERVLCDRFNY
jgi:hypothetical protein